MTAPIEAAIGGLGAMMLWHIALMNGLAPLIAILTRRWWPQAATRTLPWAGLSQIVLIWGWHAPGVMGAAMHVPLLGLAMHISLFAAALWFWTGIVNASGTERWRAIVVLLLTGKLFCLLGALLVFGRSDIYGMAGMNGGAAAIADQQLAGLIMLVACPLTYVLAGIVISARWYSDLENQREIHERGHIIAHRAPQ